MAWTVRSLLPDLPLIELTVSGTITHEDSGAMRRAARAVAESEGLARVLYDAADLVHLPSSTDIIEVADSVSGTRLPPGFRNAHVRPVDPWAAMWTDHWVAAASNRGIPTAVFHTREEAVDWLLSTDPPPQDGI